MQPQFSLKWRKNQNQVQTPTNHNHYGLIHTYAKVEDKCASAVCNQLKSCHCALAHEYYAILEVLDIDDDQLPKYRGMTVVDHITQVKASNRCEKCS